MVASNLDAEGTPTFSCRNGEYFKNGEPLDVLLELCELTGEVERLRGVQSGVASVLTALEQELADLRTAVSHWQRLAGAAADANAKHQDTIRVLEQKLKKSC